MTSSLAQTLIASGTTLSLILTFQPFALRRRYVDTTQILSSDVSRHGSTAGMFIQPSGGLSSGQSRRRAGTTKYTSSRNVPERLVCDDQSIALQMDTNAIEDDDRNEDSYAGRLLPLLCHGPSVERHPGPPRRGGERHVIDLTHLLPANSRGAQVGVVNPGLVRGMSVCQNQHMLVTRDAPRVHPERNQHRGRIEGRGRGGIHLRAVRH